jgi:two-component system sensor histidine kinase DegS
MVTYPDMGNDGLDDYVQKFIASLEHIRDRIGRVGDLAHQLYAALSHELVSLEQAEPAQTGGEPADLAAAAGRHLADLAAAGADPEAFRQAVEAHAEAIAAARIAAERRRLREEWLTAWRSRLESLGQVAEESKTMAEEIGASLSLLAANIRKLGSYVESAQQSRALGLHVIRAQEEERRRLAREIHDGPTQLLNSVVLRIDVCQRFVDTDPQRLRGELQQLKELVRLSLQDVRKIIFDLRPMALDDLGLIPALRTFLKDFQARTGIETDFSVFGNDRRYDPAFEIAIFRIVQEALSNVYKHAGASRVWVKIETTGGREVKVQVKDDGCGFDPAQVRPGTGGSKFGLVAMRERAELLGGTIDIQSAPGQGTKLTCVFPLPE